MGAKDLLNSRMAYVAVSRGQWYVQLFTNYREKLPTALGHEVSHKVRTRRSTSPNNPSHPSGRLGHGMNKGQVSKIQQELHSHNGGSCMSKYFAVAIVLAVSSVAFAQTPSQNSGSGTKHYRLTFVVDSGQGEVGKQSFVLDVPVMPGKMGVARANLVSGSDGDAQSVVQELFQCSNVHASATGLALDITVQSDREAPAIPGVIPARHQHGQFQRTVDLQLGKPTQVTEEMHYRVLGNTDPALAAALKQPAPTITVTAETL